MLEEIPQPGVDDLGVSHRRGRVGQGRQAQPAVAQAHQAFPHVRVGRQRAHPLPDRLPVVVPKGDTAAGGQHVERGHADRPEVGVGAGDRGDKRRLEHLLEPGLACRGVPKDAFELRIQRAEVEQRLIHVEDDHAGHGTPLGTAASIADRPAARRRTRCTVARTKPHRPRIISPRLSHYVENKRMGPYVGKSRWRKTNRPPAAPPRPIRPSVMMCWAGSAPLTSDCDGS